MLFNWVQVKWTWGQFRGGACEHILQLMFTKEKQENVHSMLNLSNRNKSSSRIPVFQITQYSNYQKHWTHSWYTPYVIIMYSIHPKDWKWQMIPLFSCSFSQAVISVQKTEITIVCLFNNSSTVNFCWPLAPLIQLFVTLEKSLHFICISICLPKNNVYSIYLGHFNSTQNILAGTS